MSYLEESDCEWALVTGPTEEPLSIDEAKLHARIEVDDENLSTASYLQAAREAGQAFLNRAFFTQTWKLQLAGFDDVIWLPMAAPLQTTPTAPVVQYYDGDGNLQTLSTTYYDVDAISEPGRIVRKPDQTYPTVQSDRLRPVTITYVCGWATVAAIPEAIKQGMRVYISLMTTNRSGDKSGVDAAEALWMSAGQVFWRPPHCLASAYTY